MLDDNYTVKNYILKNNLEGSPLLDKLVHDAALTAAHDTNNRVSLTTTKLNTQINFLTGNLGWTPKAIIQFIEENQ